MNQTDSFSIQFFGIHHVETIDWPVVERREKAVRVATPGGEVWLPLWRFAFRKYSVKQTGDFLDLLEEVTAGKDDSLIQVWKSGRGRTEKSHRCRVVVRIADPIQPGEFILRRHVYLLPASQISRLENKWMAPVWLLKKKLKDGESLPRAHWRGMKVVRAQVTAVMNRITEVDAQCIAAENRRKEEARAKAAAEATGEAARVLELQQQIGDDGEAAVVFCKKFTLAELHKLGWTDSYRPSWPMRLRLNDSFGLTSLAKLVDIARADPKFQAWKTRHAGQINAVPKPRAPKPKAPDQVLEHCNVAWVDWIGPSSSKTKMERSASNCTVRYFGKKREIVLANGTIIVKMDGPNLRISQG